MSNNLKYYPFGYAFSEEKLKNLPTHYKEVIILDKYVYAHDEDIKTNVHSKNNHFIIIHGDFVYAGIEMTLNKKELQEYLLANYISNYTNFLNALDYIAGRYIIIVGNKDNVNVYPDATITRTTYYSTEHNVIASHAALINDEFKYGVFKNEKRIPEYTNSLLSTPYNNIKSMLPNYYLNFYKKKQYRFFPREENKYKNLSEEQRFELFEKFWSKQAEYFFSEFDNFILSLSGGGDSRFLFALLKKYKEKIQFFTYTTIDGQDKSSEAAKSLTIDYNIVLQMLEDININHKFMYYIENKKELTPLELQLLNKNTIGRHSSFLIPYVREYYSEKNLKHIRGNLLEIGQARYYRNDYKESNIEESKNIFDKRHKKGVKKEFFPFIDNYYKEFVELMNYGNDIYDYHILDLHYWELRMGRWHPEILNTHDIAFDTISPYNHRAMIDITLSFPYEKRRDEYFYQEIINRNYPILNFYGDNNIKNLYEQLRDKKYKE